MILSKTYTFESAHQLPDWPDIHGHSYEVQISIKGEGDYVMPLRQFEEILKPVVAEIDHRMLNDIIDIPTMENIARWFASKLKDLPLTQIIISRPTIGAKCIMNDFGS